MSLKLAFLGTGTCNSTPRNPSALALSDGNEILLIDCGGGCYHQLARLNDNHFRYNTISTILLTHFHIDHVSGLADILWGEMWDKRSQRIEPITIAGPPGLVRFMNNHILPLIGNYSIPFKIISIDLEDGAIFKGSYFSAQSFKVVHGDAACGYLIDTGIKKLAITGDTGFCDNLVNLLSASDIAVMEWSMADYCDHPSHISRTDIERLLNLKIFPSKTYFTHIYPSPGTSFYEQVRFNRKILNGYKKSFFFPQDLETTIID
ncbi:MAG: MBL fold metallo-hydrolase [Spirochaetes bacterium]|nr:MBL fold metallo-hydrolase [Spirochaetota bacterium]